MERKIGIREAKAHLSRILQSVREEKAEYVITDHGRPVARLVPLSPQEAPLEERVRRLEERGMLQPRQREQRALPPPLPLEPKGLAQNWLQEERGHDERG